jgi:hypothetical protein
MAFNLETEIVEQWVKKSDVLMILHEIVLIELNANFNNISVISWRSVLLVDETGVPGENHYIAGSAKCSTKPLLTASLSTIEAELDVELLVH